MTLTGHMYCVCFVSLLLIEISQAQNSALTLYLCVLKCVLLFIFPGRFTLPPTPLLRSEWTACWSPTPYRSTWCLLAWPVSLSPYTLHQSSRTFTHTARTSSVTKASSSALWQHCIIYYTHLIKGPCLPQEQDLKEKSNFIQNFIKIHLIKN